MPVEFIGMITPQKQSETLAPHGPAIDRDHTRRFAQVQGAAGVDRNPMLQHSTGPWAGHPTRSRLKRPDGVAVGVTTGVISVRRELCSNELL